MTITEALEKLKKHIRTEKVNVCIDASFNKENGENHYDVSVTYHDEDDERIVHNGHNLATTVDAAIAHDHAGLEWNEDE